MKRTSAKLPASEIDEAGVPRTKPTGDPRKAQLPAEAADEKHVPDGGAARRRKPTGTKKGTGKR